MPGNRTRCLFRAETFAALIPVANVTEPLRRASQLKRVQSWPLTTVLAAEPVADEPAAAAPPLQATMRRATVSAVADETFIDTVWVYPVGFGTNLGSGGTGFLGKKKPLIEGPLVKR